MGNLLPCPFCGGDAVTREWRRQDVTAMQQGAIGCDSCGIHMYWSDIRTESRHDTDREEACINKWNRRDNCLNATGEE